MNENQNLIKCGYVSLIGLPNAGKSSLVNALTQEQLCIVSPKAQTTWHAMQVYYNSPEAQWILVDTPGIQESSKALNKIIASETKTAVRQTKNENEILVLVLDAAEIAHKLKEKKHQSFDFIERCFQESSIKLPAAMNAVIVINKSDLVSKAEWRDEVSTEVSRLASKLFNQPPAVLWVNRNDQAALDNLKNTINQLLPLGQANSLFDAEELTNKTVRELSAEFIREQCFYQLQQEIPYSVAVEINQFSEDDPKIVRISAVLHVEKESQKAIVIGEGAKKIKSIGIKSRERIETLLDRKVFLSLKAKVTPKWATKNECLERFGYAQR